MEMPEQTPRAAYFPDPTGYVVDQSDVLSPQVESEIAEKLRALDSVAQVSVVTVETTQPMDEKEYAIKLAETWGIGDKETDNGVLFLIVTGDRRLRIEVGRGLEDELTDSKSGQILDNHVVPQLKAGNWEKGISDGVDAIIEEIK